jgi:ethanolaminephosphotransferase
MATWEEYYTGILALPPLNGPNEGLAIMYGLYFMTAYIGPGIWKEPNYLFPKVPNNQALIILIAVASIGQSLLSGMFFIFFLI